MDVSKCLIGCHSTNGAEDRLREGNKFGSARWPLDWSLCPEWLLSWACNVCICVCVELVGLRSTCLLDRMVIRPPCLKNVAAFLGGGRPHDCGLFPRDGVVQGTIVCGDGGGCVVSDFSTLVFSQSGGQPFPCLTHVVGGAVMTWDVIIHTQRYPAPHLHTYTHIQYIHTLSYPCRLTPTLDG